MCCISDVDNPLDWMPVTPGSLLLPKDPDIDDIIKIGEIFKKPNVDSYFKSTCLPSSRDYNNECLKSYNVGQDWMTQMKYEIGDTRLGDLVIPATHDSGTSEMYNESYLIDNTFLFGLGERVTPSTLANWGLTQDDDVLTQLENGFRKFDLRPADCQEPFNDTFRWWHGLSAGLVEDDLQDIAQYSRENPEEILILEFWNFARAGNPDTGGTLPIRPARKIELSDMILDYLSDYMVSYGDISENPTMNEVLATGSNIILTMDDEEVREQSELYWPPFIHANWAGVTNSEDLFNHRSSVLIDYLLNHADKITEVSACVTPDERNVVGALLREYGELAETIIEIITPPGTDTSNLDPDYMSFEGMFIDLLNTSHYGVNLYGMSVRREDLYSIGASVNYRGMNDMIRHWLARPGLYKPNMIYVDDATISSEAVTLAILANLGEIPREASISLQGNTRTGFYFWDNYTANGGDEGLLCNSVVGRFEIVSDSYGIHEVYEAQTTGYELVMQEGQYPTDTEVLVYVSSRPENDEWFNLGVWNIQFMIDYNDDLYIRGDDLGDAGGFGYIADTYDLYGPECGTAPDDGYRIFYQWL